MHLGLINPAVVGYICAMGLALAYLVQRHELVHRLAVLSTLAGWAAHTVALIVRAVELGAPPFGSLPDAVSVAVWVIVLLEVLIEQRSGLRVLGAFVLPIAVVLILKATTARPATLAPALAGAWVWVHIALALIGIAAFVFNFVGAIMYLLQERQLKTKRPGAFYYRLPSLETLDFLGQLLSLNQEKQRVKSLEPLLRGQARRPARLAFRYWLLAADRKYWSGPARSQ